MSNIWSKLINFAGNITGTLPVANGGTGVTTSTGSVNVVLSTSPTLVTPILGAATATSITFGGAVLSTYAANTWSPTITKVANLSGTPTVVKAQYNRVGNMVCYQLRITGLTIDTTGLRTVFLFQVPVATTTSGDPKCGSAIATNSLESVGTCDDNNSATGAYAVFPAILGINGAATTFSISGVYAIL